MAWYRTWFGTPYYKLLYGHRDEDDAEVWVSTILRRCEAGPGTTVLDMACGRGRHARWFAEVGCDVTGIDLSAESIAEARHDVPSAHFAVHDIRVPFASAAFDLVVCLFTSLGYFEDEDDDRKALAAAFAAARPGGRFVLDFMNSVRVLKELVPMECVQAGGVRFTIARSSEDGMVVKRILAEDASGRHHFEERVSALAPERLMQLVREAGFVVLDSTDGPEPEPFDPIRSQRLVIWAQRPLT
ncbi:MAG: class I SAM-dependent methyltransferase [Flavobacteriales bacterium]|jgi:SAM-dependent methyltransferase|nr:class I SAM-dependent methyltransferase [Flavobacteriales bacterium]MBK7942024.1 class I SAM-dependent methyltransferase [Flavobacteriales bacterium]MBK8947824.1 class I SAM-dependent methyltransferase [Flavobacteriales bacterium]MBK9700570.1 class I SAM-dependent methyltransferase [Flavobacteriales bacterium]